MYLFSRTAVVRANPRDMFPWVQQITEVVRGMAVTPLVGPTVTEVVGPTLRHAGRL
jgi:hypothetical protein